MAGTPDFTLQGKPLSPEEYELFKGRPGDAIKGGSGLINDLNATGLQRVADLRSGKTKSTKPAPPTKPPVASRTRFPSGKQAAKRNVRRG
jgi:hypothetical protein